MKQKIIICIAVMLCTAGLYSEEKKIGKMRIAVMELKADGVSDVTSRTITSMIRTDFVNSGKFIVVERTQMDKILKEQGFQKTGCTDQECAVEMGKMLSVRKMMIGEVSELRGQTYIAVRLVDVENSEIESAEKITVAKDGKLDESVNILTTKIINRINKDKESDPVKIVYGKSPEGLSAGYNYFIPGNSDFKENYSSLQGGMLSYTYPINEYFALAGAAGFIGSSDTTGNTTVMFNSYSAGCRLGVPMFGFMYPYIGLAMKGTWLMEKGEKESADFLGYGGDGTAGFAFMFGGSLAIYGEFTYSYSKVTDELATDISGTAFSAGITYKLF